MFNILINKFILRPICKKKLAVCGKNFRLGFSSLVSMHKNISVGDFFFTGPYFYMSTSKAAKIYIKNSVMFGPYCKVIGGNHNVKWSGGHMMYAPENISDKGIVIEDGVWVGAGATILDGAFVSEGAVIAAGSVVVGYVPPYVISMGMPAKKFKKRFDRHELLQILENTNSKYDLIQIESIYNDLGI
jgi:acetyltransferase-like isoleucine patch superfamily enzyme